MKIARDPTSRVWKLTSGRHVLYEGRRSPWDDPRVMREAAEREETVRGARQAWQEEQGRPH